MRCGGGAGCGWWFDGEEAQFKHEKGVEYVARLLAERGPLHALDLASKAGGAGGAVSNSPGRVHRTNRARTEASLREVLDVGGTVQERSAALDEKEARQALMDQRQITGKEAFKKAINKSRFEQFREAS